MMKKSRYREERIIGILQHEAGVKTADLCRDHAISSEPALRVVADLLLMYAP
jgi:hypothetical protein